MGRQPCRQPWPRRGRETEGGPFWGDGKDRSSPRPSRIPQEMASSPKLQDRYIGSDLCVQAFSSAALMRGANLAGSQRMWVFKAVAKTAFSRAQLDIRKEIHCERVAASTRHGTSPVWTTTKISVQKRLATCLMGKSRERRDKSRMENIVNRAVRWGQNPV